MPNSKEYWQEYSKRPERQLARKLYNAARRDQVRGLIKDAKSRPCADCGLWFPSYVMDLDHVRGVKLFGLATAGALMKSPDAVRREIAKCDPVCANCHRIRTHERRQG